MRTLQISIEPKEISGFWNIDDAKNEEYCVATLEDVEIQTVETFVKFKSATDLKGFEALHNVVLDIDNLLLCSDP